MTASFSEFEQFLKRTSFSNYQKIDLPYGLRIHGQDHSKKIAAILPDDLSGKSVLDVGCYYGLYCHEAARRGARRVLGVELNEERFTIAWELARLWEDGVEIRQGDIMGIDIQERFDLILFLSVLHHIKDPVQVMRRLAELCTDTLVVEFCSPLHRLHRKKSQLIHGSGRLMTLLNRILIRALDEHVGLILTGDEIQGERGYDWTYFFNRRGFLNVFVTQNRLFKEVTFKPSPQKADRILAFCKVA